jgi:hypothetical protein
VSSLWSRITSVSAARPRGIDHDYRQHTGKNEARFAIWIALALVISLPLPPTRLVSFLTHCVLSLDRERKRFEIWRKAEFGHQQGRTIFTRAQYHRQVRRYYFVALYNI